MQTSLALPMPANGGQAAGLGDAGKPGASKDDAVDAFTEALAAMMGIVAGPVSPAAPTAAATGQPTGATSALAQSSQAFAAQPGLAPPVPANADATIEAAVVEPAPAVTGKVAPQPQSPSQPLLQTSASIALTTAVGNEQTAPSQLAAPDPTPPQPTLAAAQPAPLSVQAATLALQAPAASGAKAGPASADKAVGKTDGDAAANGGPALATAGASAGQVVAQAAQAQADESDHHGEHPAGSEADTRAEPAQSNADPTNNALQTPQAVTTPVPIQSATGAQAAAPTVASQIATQVVKSVEGKSTRFDLALEPAGLGRVDVRVQIDPQGQVTAQFSFDNPHAAAEAKTQSGQLQQALEQAGFNVAQGGLSFDVGGQGAGFARQDAPASQPQTFASGAPTSDFAEITPATAFAAAIRPSSGVDITI
jgi:flagellar hook-length control protein FliK